MIRKNNETPIFMIIPMIDIIFFLLVFFMMRSVEYIEHKQELPVNLPTATYQQTIENKNVESFNISITQDNRIYLDKEEKDIETIKSIIKGRMDNNKVIVIINTDKDSYCQSLITVISEIKSIGVSSISISTRGVVK